MRGIFHRTGLSILAPPDSFLDGLWVSVCLACVQCGISEIRRWQVRWVNQDAERQVELLTVYSADVEGRGGMFVEGD